MLPWLRRWYQTRRSARGLSTSVGMVAGLIVFVTFLTAGIGAVQAVRVHAVLAQAAQSAVASEQNNGCWTPAAAHAVTQTLQTGGVPASSVTVTEDTGTLAAYGSPVDVGLKTQVSVSVLGLQVAALPISAGAQGTSFFAKGVSGTSHCVGGTGMSGPTITHVALSQWTTTGATITITGNNLGSSMPALTAAGSGGHDSASLQISQNTDNVGYRASSGSPFDTDGLHYIRWSPTQIVVQYPGNWSGAGASAALAAGTPLTVTVWNQGLSVQATVTPQAPTEAVSLIPSANTPYTGQAVTLTANANVAGTLSIVNATTNQAIKTCTNATTCVTTVSHMTQNSPVSSQYVATVSGVGTSGSSGTHTVTWNPAATITASRWWLGNTNQTIPPSGVTLPAGTNESVWWSFTVANLQASYQGWSQGWWNTPDTAGPSFNGTAGWLPTSLGPGTYHVDLTFFFANGAVQELVSPPVTMN